MSDTAATELIGKQIPLAAKVLQTQAIL